jgi:segregation and condensation protein A
MVVTADFTVRLDQVFKGPMDLLLHLVREREVDIHEIEIGEICDEYLGYMKNLEDLDIEVAAEFLVMAATLMSIKSRSLLPKEEVDLEAELDPRDELIQRLIEYRRFKEAAGDLGERLEGRAQVFRHGFRPQDKEEPELDVSELSQWDLLGVFSRLMRETLAHRAMVIEADERPMRWYVSKLVSWVRSGEALTLRSLVETAADEAPSRRMMIGTFCALLELMKLGVVTVWQPEALDEIHLRIGEGHEDDIEEVVRTSGFDDETTAEVEASEEASPDTTGTADAPGAPEDTGAPESASQG